MSFEPFIIIYAVFIILPSMQTNKQNNRFFFEKQTQPNSNKFLVNI